MAYGGGVGVGSVVFECEEGEVGEHEVDGILEVKSEDCD